MQIILVQTEVEQALRNYVASRLTLAEGTTFSIDLAATRGVNGITATIDLVEPGQSTAAPAGSIPRAQSTKPAAAPAVETAKKPASEVQADPATQASAAQENAATAQETGSAGQEAETGPLADGQVAGAAEAVAEEVPAEKPKSLFGGLQRPKNA